MKKVALIAVAMVVAASVMADLRQYTIGGLGTGENAGVVTPIIISNNGVADGAFEVAPVDGTQLFGAYSVFNLDTLVETPAVDTSGNAGWFGALGGFVLQAFPVTDQEGESIAVRYYNGATIETSKYYIESAPILLPDLTNPILPGADELASDFSASSWVAIPEPATIGLFGIAGLGMYLSRRKRR